MINVFVLATPIGLPDAGGVELLRIFFHYPYLLFGKAVDFIYQGVDLFPDNIQRFLRLKDFSYQGFYI
jgi:hypothetical protein